MTKDVEKYLVKKRIKWEEDNIWQLQVGQTMHQIFGSAFGSAAVTVYCSALQYTRAASLCSSFLLHACTHERAWLRNTPVLAAACHAFAQSGSCACNAQCMRPAILKKHLPFQWTGATTPTPLFNTICALPFAG